MTIQFLLSISALWPSIERQHYWQLPPAERTAVDSLTHPRGGRLVEHWSFVPHPEIVRKLSAEGFSRYVVLIDTISSEVYHPVLKFLRSQQSNAVTYYTGGYADFICDLHLTESRFRIWEAELKSVLKGAGVNKYYRQAHGVKGFYTVLRINRSHILCGKVLESLAPLSRDTIRRIEEKRGLFELALRDYRSPDALELAGGSEMAMAEYLEDLQRQGALLCYRVVADAARYWSTDYELLRIPNRAAPGLIELAKEDDRTFLGPIDEFHSIDVIWSPEESEKDLSHLFINSYQVPGDRLEWKRHLYEWAHKSEEGGALDINLYNYPLEATVDETPTWISDYPEFLDKVRKYQSSGPRIVEFGTATHPFVGKAPPAIGLPISGLPFHGITFGLPGTGKTNSDLIICTQLQHHLENIIVLDAEAGSWGKLTDDMRKAATRIEVTDWSNLAQDFGEWAAVRGLVVVEFQKERLSELVDAGVQFVARASDESPRTGQPRVIRHLLMIEEAHNLWLGASDARLSRSFLSILDETWRKGWSIWLSTQRPTQLGHDEAYRRDLLDKLKNVIIHGMDNNDQIRHVTETFANQGHDEVDQKFVREQTKTTGKGRALVRSVTLAADNRPSYLPPIVVAVGALG